MVHWKIVVVRERQKKKKEKITACIFGTVLSTSILATSCLQIILLILDLLQCFLFTYDITVSHWFVFKLTFIFFFYVFVFWNVLRESKYYFESTHIIEHWSPEWDNFGKPFASNSNPGAWKHRKILWLKREW